MTKKEIVLSDETLNRYGYRVLTRGIQLEAFLRNPVMFYNHNRSTLPIGRWENIRRDDGKLIATPVFDTADAFALQIKRKFEDGFINAASIGLSVVATSNEQAAMLPGQKWPTVTKCELFEVSIVDIPANANAIKLYKATAAESGVTYEEITPSAEALLGFVETTQTDEDPSGSEPTEQTTFELNIDFTQEPFASQIAALLSTVLKIEIEKLEQEIVQKVLHQVTTPTQADPAGAKPPTAGLQVPKVIISAATAPPAPDPLLQKLAAHPNRTYEQWWLKDAAFLKQLKEKHPDHYEALASAQ
jgi:HK97 family phage prohead protease